jgi:hypothetical protein
MGYCITQDDASFRIERKHVPAALEAIKALGLRCEIDEESGERMKTFAWVDNKFADAETLESALLCCRWQAEYDKDGNIVHIQFLGEKLGDDVRLFEVLAPFVTHRSYIEMEGEDNERWRWVFWREELREEVPSLVWPYESVTDVQDLLQEVNLE